MSRHLRNYLLVCIAIAFAYLLWHAREPLRLNIGDPWSDANVLSAIKYVKQYGFLETSFVDILDVGPLTADSYRYIHYPPFSEIIYSAVGKYFGVSDIGTFRLFGIAFSGLAMFLLFQYARRLYSDRIALIATMLFTTSLIWLMYADSMHQAPVMQASGFLALWGLVRAIETKQRKYYVAAIGGSFACFFTSYDYWLYLPAAVLFTVYVKAGNPFARGNRHFVVLCALGCALGISAKCATVIGAVGWHEFVADVRLQFFERSTSKYDPGFTSSVPTMLRRLTLIFTPLVWVAIVSHGWRTLRAPTIAAAIKDSVGWMLIVTLMFFNIFAQLVASQMLASQPMLPFYSIGCALIIDRLLEGTKLRRGLGYAWLGFAPVWGMYFMLTHPRSFLERDDVAKVNAYLAANDKNDFMMSNLMSMGHIQASFERHYWAAPAPRSPANAYLDVLYAFEATGTDYVHAAIFTTPDSRFIDKSLWPLAMPRRQWSVTGWPFLYRAKANRMIREFDTSVMRALAAIQAKPVMRLSNFDLYRFDRATMLELAGRNVPVVTHIDAGSPTFGRHQLRGWTGPYLSEQTGLAVSAIDGSDACIYPEPDPARSNPCKTVLTKTGLEVKGNRVLARALFMIRLERACAVRLRFTLATPSLLGVSVGKYTERVGFGRDLVVSVPAEAVTAGINVVTVDNQLGFQTAPAELVAIDIEPACP